jgi:hypothetical protein
MVILQLKQYSRFTNLEKSIVVMSILLFVRSNRFTVVGFERSVGLCAFVFKVNTKIYKTLK